MRNPLKKLTSCVKRLQNQKKCVILRIFLSCMQGVESVVEKVTCAEKVVQSEKAVHRKCYGFFREKVVQLKQFAYFCAGEKGSERD